MDRQRILLIFGAAWVSAALLTWFVYAKMSGSGGGTSARVVAAARDLGAGTRLRKADLKLVSIDDDTVPRGAIFDQNAALDRVLLFPTNTNEPLTTSKLTRMAGAEGFAAMIEPGKRAVAVSITDTSSAGGLIQPRSHVDVLFTRTGTMREALTSTILQDVIVLSIGRTTEIASQDGKSSSSTAIRPTGQTQAATLLVTPEEAKKLELAKNQGKISLALRNPLDKSTDQESEPARADALDPQLYRPMPRGVRGTIPNIRDPRVWAELTGDEGAVPVSARPKPKEEPKEPPKPRLVVDVFHGDKHVQEIFQ